jgi:CxxC-x17-CxxC domain-containing protein
MLVVVERAQPTGLSLPTGRHMEGSLSFSDKTLTCRDCGMQFTFTAGEQEFYASKGLTNEPVRCPSCRSVRKASRVDSDHDDNGGYVKYGTFASFGGRTPRQMHPATCAECGMMTEVPFVPRGDRPVYCSSCYNKIRAAESSSS